MLSPASSSAANGSLVQVSEVLGGVELVDIAIDGSNGTFWVLGANGSTTAAHRIYHLDSELEVVLGDVANPHPTGTIANNDLTTHRGIAYRPSTDTLLVLSSVGPRLEQALVVREIEKDGAVVAGGEFTIALPDDDDASLYGLTYDPLTARVWTLDIQNDQLLRVAPSGEVETAFLLPGKTTPHTQIRGQGVSFAQREEQGFLHVSVGDIFTPGPSAIIELTTTPLVSGEVSVGVRTGAETPLVLIETSDLRGIESYSVRQGSQRTAIVADGGRIFVIERVTSSPLPPGELRCLLTLTNEVQLDWKNFGSGEGGIYGGSIQVLRDGVPLSTVGGDATSYRDVTPIDGTSTYSLRASESSGGSLSAESSGCAVTVGPGGLIDWTPFPGVSISDLTEDPETGDIFATDVIAGALYRFNKDLDLIDGPIPAPFDNPGGIVYLPSLTLGFPPQVQRGLLAVAEATGNRVRIVSVDAPEGPVITTINMRLDEIESPEILGLTFMDDRDEFLLLERASRRVHRFRNNGTALGSCAPPFIITSPLDHGITYDPIQDSFLLTFEDGEVRELFAQATCSPTGFGFPLEALGDAFDQKGSNGGVQISANTLLVAGRGSNAIYRVLIFPFSPDFIRGDFDGSGAVNITDAHGLATYLFLDGQAPDCNDAADVNDDGILDVSDPVYLLFALFVAGSPPPFAPFPTPGNDPTFRDNLGCAG